MDKIISLCKRRGFIFAGSQIYGGLASSWDYGPLGSLLKENIKRAWLQSVILEREDIEPLDTAILMHRDVWQASGHTENFSDYLSDCRQCKKRFRIEDRLITLCPACGGELTSPRNFNLMFKTYIGPVEEEGSLNYLRPETAQGIFVNFVNVQIAMRRKLPFGIAQIGKSFRNEITPGNFIFRSREFEQMELEYFVYPEEDNKWFEYWQEERLSWYIKLGINKANLRLRPHTKEELAHYAKQCTDIEYNFPFGWAEVEGIANRKDYDLRQHSRLSGRDLTIFDEQRDRHIFPYVIEPSCGVDRIVLLCLVDAYKEEKVRGERRVVLSLSRSLSPIKVAVLPLLRNRDRIVELAKLITGNLRKELSRSVFGAVVRYDDTGSIGRLYRRQDEIGTPYCITVDVESLEDKKVTVRDRDTMEQERIEIENLDRYLYTRLSDNL